MTEKTQMVNIFCKVDRAAYYALVKIATISGQQRRPIYRLALQYAVTKMEFWRELGIAESFSENDVMSVFNTYSKATKRIKAWQEEEPEESG